MLEHRIARYKRGDTYVDDEGVEWYVVDIVFQTGEASYSKVRVGSIAHSIISRHDGTPAASEASS